MVLTWLQNYLLKVRTSSRISHKKLWLFACAIRARDFLELQTVDYVIDPLRVGPALHFLACLYLQPTDDRMVTPLPTESLRYRANGIYTHIYRFLLWLWYVKFAWVFACSKKSGDWLSQPNMMSLPSKSVRPSALSRQVSERLDWTPASWLTS